MQYRPIERARKRGLPARRVIGGWPVFAAAITLFALAACSDDEVERPALGAPFDCTDPIDVVDELPDAYEEYGDVVALPVADPLQLGRSGMDDDPGSSRRFSKFGLLIRPRSEFELHVGPNSQANALITWGNTNASKPVGSLAFGSCDGNPDTWLVYPGGVWLLEPSCTELVVVTADSSVVVRVPVEAECP